MKTTPENAVKKKLKAVLDAIPENFYYSAVAGPYSIGGIPDIVGCHRGRFYGCEVKKPGGKPTALQILKKREIEAAGGKWFLVDGDEGITQVKNWMES